MPKSRARRPSIRIGNAKLDAMITEAIVDCYDVSEQAVGLFTMIETNLVLPFTTFVLGIAVTVESVELNEGGQVVAICACDHHRQAISVLDLPMPPRRPAGAEWIEAYRRWLTLT